MKVLITGATGLIGTALTPFLSSHGHGVTGLVRCAGSTADRIASWNPVSGEVSPAAVDGADAIVHLAGVNITAKRWSTKFKSEIRRSRVDATEALCTHLVQSAAVPRIMIAASAVGYYGDCGEALLTEASSLGTGFLAELARDWEQACNSLVIAETRVVNLRIGVVLSPSGGALQKMLLPFRVCVGGILGDGNQYMSWIGMDDLLGIIGHILEDDSLSGPVNATSPNPVTNHEFTKTLGKALKRPTIIPLPAFAARMAFGEMANEILLSSARVIPERISNSGYEYRHSRLEGSLRYLLGRAG